MRRTWAVLLAVFLLCAAAGFGQGKKKSDSNTRSVVGVVTSAEDATVSNAVVKLKNTRSLEVRSFYTQADGSYRFYELSKDVDYELQADYQGASSGTKKLSSFDSRKEAIINLKLNAKK